MDLISLRKTLIWTFAAPLSDCLIFLRILLRKAWLNFPKGSIKKSIYLNVYGTILRLPKFLKSSILRRKLPGICIHSDWLAWTFGQQALCTWIELNPPGGRGGPSVLQEHAMKRHRRATRACHEEASWLMYWNCFQLHWFLIGFCSINDCAIN